MTHVQSETLAKIEVLSDLESVVHELMEAHEAKRILWFPSELLTPAPDTDPDELTRRSVPARNFAAVEDVPNWKDV